MKYYELFIIERIIESATTITNSIYYHNEESIAPVTISESLSDIIRNECGHSIDILELSLLTLKEFKESNKLSNVIKVIDGILVNPLFYPEYEEGGLYDCIISFLSKLRTILDGDECWDFYYIDDYLGLLIELVEKVTNLYEEILNGGNDYE